MNIPEEGISLNNFLREVSTPETYGCRLLGYSRSHSILWLKIGYSEDNSPETFYIGFEAVWYIQCPVIWRGIDFRLGSLDEKLQILQGDWLKLEQYKNVFAEKHQLFKIERTDMCVQILAGNAFVMRRSPKISIDF